MVNHFDYENYSNEPFAACENPDVPMGKWLLNNIPEKPNKLLDVGCGTGVHTEWFNLQGVDTIGITINHKEIEKSLSPKVQYGNMLDIPFNDKSFDCVFCLGTLEHTHSPFIALCEFNRVLKDGGYLFLDMCGIQCTQIVNPIYNYHKSVLFPIQIRDLLLRTKFKVIGGSWKEEVNGNIYKGNSCAHYLAQKISDTKL